MKLKDLAGQFTSTLAVLYGEAEAKAIFMISIEALLGYKRSDFILNGEVVLDPLTLDRFDEILVSLQEHQPIQYILGETYFYGLKFKVSPAVLIPRPETEELVEWILTENASGHAMQKLSIMDIGTGSGCIAVSLKKQLPRAAVTAVDISRESLAVAKDNAALHEVAIDFVHQDILAGDSRNLPRPLDIIVSNPPYVKIDEKPQMSPNVLMHEPHQALFVANEDPLLFYRTIADLALTNLRNGGQLFFEINEYLGKETVELLQDKGFKNIVLRKDLQGKDRMVRGVKIG